jgi:hypothetical protein
MIATLAAEAAVPLKHWYISTRYQNIISQRTVTLICLYLTAPVFEDEGLPAGTPTLSTTYEELRRKNREEYELKKTKPFRYVCIRYHFFVTVLHSVGLHGKMLTLKLPDGL